MKRIYLIYFLFLMAMAAAYPACAGSGVPSELSQNKEEKTKKTLQEDAFSVSSEDLSSSDSLNRISGGDLDRGYSSSEQSYESERHSYKGPFDHPADKMPDKTSY